MSIQQSTFSPPRHKHELQTTIPTMAPLSIDMLQHRMQQMKTMPTLPAILFPLLRNLDQPPEQVDVPRIVDLISHDKSLAAQCLHMANSPLFGRWGNVDSIRGAVMALGTGRVRDIAMSCCMLNIMPKDDPLLDPRTFWEHSLGVALVSRRLARRVGFRDPEKAYLAGLLHDLGMVTNLLLIPEHFRAVVVEAFASKRPFHNIESEYMGLTHCATGALLSDQWHLSGDIQEVIRWHHGIERASLYRGLTSLVHLGDLICRSCGLGYGFAEEPPPDPVTSAGWAILAEECPAVRTMGAARFASEMCLYVDEVKRLVGVLFRLESK